MINDKIIEETDDLDSDIYDTFFFYFLIFFTIEPNCMYYYDHPSDFKIHVPSFVWVSSKSKTVPSNLE